MNRILQECFILGEEAATNPEWRAKCIEMLKDKNELMKAYLLDAILCGPMDTLPERIEKLF